jgi:hypothetical protein
MLFQTPSGKILLEESRESVDGFAGEAGQSRRVRLETRQIVVSVCSLMFPAAQV